MKNYDKEDINIRYSKEDAGFIAYVIGESTISAIGDGRVVALAELEIALSAVKEVQLEDRKKEQEEAEHAQ